jgi:hypothetical protein
MDASIPNTPVRYSADIEQPAEDEQKTIAELIKTLRMISETTFEDSGHATRSVHAKSHGLLHGEIKVLDSLPEVLRQGMFAKPGTYKAVIRLSTPPGDVLTDSITTPRGMALKIIGVDGARLPGSESDTTQDFVMVNGPAFLAPDAKTFLSSLKLLAKTTDKAEGMKKGLSAVLRGTEKMVEALGGESATLKSMGGHAQTHPLGETFYTQAPLRFGSYIAKVSVAPIAPAQLALQHKTIDLHGNPDGLRSAVNDYFATHDAEYELRVQLCTDLKTMPVEDASVIWPEDQSPYIPVARIRIPAQKAWDPSQSGAEEDALSFSPWHGLDAHRPLGSVMRARKPAYESSAAFRAEHNGCPIHEPRRKAA